MARTRGRAPHRINGRIGNEPPHGFERRMTVFVPSEAANVEVAQTWDQHTRAWSAPTRVPKPVAITVDGDLIEHDA